MITKLISLAGLLLLLSSPAFANAAHTDSTAPIQIDQSQNVVSVDVDTNVSASTIPPAQPQVQQLAWQRVGAPLSLEG